MGSRGYFGVSSIFFPSYFLLLCTMTEFASDLRSPISERVSRMLWPRARTGDLYVNRSRAHSVHCYSEEENSTAMFECSSNNDFIITKERTLLYTHGHGIRAHIHASTERYPVRRVCLNTVHFTRVHGYILQ